MGEKRSMGKVYEFTPGKKRKLKSLDYVSPEKKSCLERENKLRKIRASFMRGCGYSCCWWLL
jgi:hypothetical protein